MVLLVGGIGVMFGIKKNQKKQPSVITVYVHGTLFHWRKILAKIPVAADLAYVPDGLTLVKDLDENTVARKMATLFCQKDSERFQMSGFYAFGWSGKLSCKERIKWAQRLAQELEKLSQMYTEKDGIEPIIRVVTFSHGGNVALNLAQFLPEDMSVELILIANPIQNDTEHFVLSDSFSKVYMIYSCKDLMQVIDPIHICRSIKNGCEKKISRRFFQYDVEKLKQVCVSVNGRHIGHFELFQMFNKHVPDVLKQVDALPKKNGTSILSMDVQDPSFTFLNGFNVVDVLKGVDKKVEKIRMCDKNKKYRDIDIDLK